MGQVTKPAALAILALSVTTSVYALPTADIPTAEPEYLAKVKTAAPEQIVSKSTITMQMKDGTTKTLQSGTNGFTCLILGDGTPVCADENAMEWRKAASAKTPQRLTHPTRSGSCICWPAILEQIMKHWGRTRHTNIGYRPART